jgi:hypothetical protein
VQLAAAAALQDLGALIFRDDALDLEQQVVLGRAPQRAVEEDQLDAAPPQLVDEENLIGVAARQAVGGVDVEPIDCPLDGRIAQPLQRRADEGAAAAPLVEEAQFVLQR